MKPAPAAGHRMGHRAMTVSRLSTPSRCPAGGDDEEVGQVHVGVDARGPAGGGLGGQPGLGEFCHLAAQADELVEVGREGAVKPNSDWPGSTPVT